MSRSDYSKGFGTPSPGSARRGDSRSTTTDRHAGSGVPAHGIFTPTRAVHERGKDARVARRADPTKRPWSRHAGPVGTSCAGIGFMVGILFLVAQGNWAAPFVLPILLGFSGFIAFWLLSTTLDVFRGL